MIAALNAPQERQSGHLLLNSFRVIIIRAFRPVNGGFNDAKTFFRLTAKKSFCKVLISLKINPPFDLPSGATLFLAKGS